MWRHLCSPLGDSLGGRSNQNTREHETHAEYQSLIKDLVLESEYLGAT
jgi:hypothetical protein